MTEKTPVNADDEKPVPALDEVGEGPEVVADDNEVVADDNEDDSHVGEKINANEWGDEIGDEL